MHFPNLESLPDSLIDLAREFTRRLRRDGGFVAQDREDLSQELMMRLSLRDAFAELSLPLPSLRQIFRQGIANYLRSRSAQKRRPTRPVVLISSRERFHTWEPIDHRDKGVGQSDFDLDWEIVLTGFHHREIQLLERWRDNDWRKPPGLSKREKKRFPQLRIKLAKQLTTLGYLPGGDTHE